MRKRNQGIVSRSFVTALVAMMLCGNISVPEVMAAEPEEGIHEENSDLADAVIAEAEKPVEEQETPDYEGYPMSDVVLPTRLMGMMGAKKLILTNAAGGVNFDYKPGDFMMITDHITTAVPSPLIGPNIDELGARFPDMSEVYSLRIREIIREEAEKLGISLREGVYAQLTGPAYETPAEIRMCRSWGADAVGMSTACEAMAARHMGMEVCGISCITNLAAGMSTKQLDHKEVQETADRVAAQFKALITAIVSNI